MNALRCCLAVATSLATAPSPLAQTTCQREEPPEPAALLPLIAQEEATRLQDPQVKSVELDGQSPSEVVLWGNLAFPPGKENSASESEKSVLWLFARRAGRLVLAGHLEHGVDAASDGFFEDKVGYRLVRGEQLGTGRRETLHIEHVNTRGGHDPRFRARTFELYSWDGTALRQTFACTIDYERVSGPERNTDEEYRRLVVLPAGGNGSLSVSDGRERTDYELTEAGVWQPQGRDVCHPKTESLLE